MGLGILILGAGAITVLILVASGSRRALLGISAGLVLAGSSASPLLVEQAFYLRFAGYAALASAAAISVRPRLRANIPIPILLLVVAAVGSVVWSANMALSFQRSAGLALLIIAALVSGAHWTSRSAARTDCSVLVIASVSILLFGLVARLTGSTWVFDVSAAGIVRYRGALENPNTIGLLAAPTVPLALGLFSSGCSTRRRWWLVVVAIILISVALSESRGGLVAVAAGLAGFTMCLAGSVRFKVTAGAAALLLVVISTWSILPASRPAGVQSLVERFQGEEQTSKGGSGRVEAWKLAVETWDDRPIGGWGFGTAEEVFGPRALAIEEVFQGANPHNAYLHVLIEVGIVAPLLLLAIAVTSCARAWRLAKEWGPLGAGIFGTLLAAVVSQMFESGFTSAGSIAAFYFWIVAGGVAMAVSRPHVPAHSYSDDSITGRRSLACA